MSICAIGGRAELLGQMVVVAVGILPDRDRPLVRGALQLRVSGLAIGGPYVGERDPLGLFALADRLARVLAPAGCGKRRDGKVAGTGRLRRPFERHHANGAEIEAQLLAVVARLDDVAAGGGGTADSKTLHLAEQNSKVWPACGSFSREARVSVIRGIGLLCTHHVPTGRHFPAHGLTEMPKKAYKINSSHCRAMPVSAF